jgi:hypothetical protein
MKPYLYILTLFIAFVSCDFGNGETATNPPVTEPQDTTLPTKVDNIQTPQELPVAELPQNSKREDAASQGISVAVAPGMKVEDLGTFILVCSEEVVKDAKCFTLERYNSKPDTVGKVTFLLKGRPFIYTEKAAGANRELEGHLQLGNQWYLVKATDKDPRWIFPYLANVELSNKAL